MYDETSPEPETLLDIELAIAEEKQEFFSFMVNSNLEATDMREVLEDYRNWLNKTHQRPDYVQDYYGKDI